MPLTKDNKQSKLILGIAAYYHDSAACIVRDGKIIAAAQEERFTRIKHDPSFPKNAILYCLDESDCTIEELDNVIFYDKPLLKFERLLETYLSVAPKGFLSFLRAMPIWLKEKLYLKSILRTELRQLIFLMRANVNQTSIEVETKKQAKPKLPQLLFSEHHQSHAASAFFPSPFDKAVVLCLDGVGEWATSSVWIGEGNQLKLLWELHFPHSLGLLYSAFTYYCGFKVNSGEYKLMGLAPYGEPVYVDLIYQHLIHLNDDGSFTLNMKYFDYPAGDVMTSKAFSKLFNGKARDPKSNVTQKEMDMACSIQVVTEDIVLKIAEYAFKKTGCKNCCLAGGVALNCVANGRLEREGPFQSIWIQPASGDAGGSIGAALLTWYEFYKNKRIVNRHLLDDMQGSYLGPSFSNNEIIKILKDKNIAFEVLANTGVYDKTAELISFGHVIGWFQGRMEFGPRALGNRTIVGDPRSEKMQTIMNLKIKNRESFRPFAPAVLSEDVEQYFNQKNSSPYMLKVSKIQDKLRLKVNRQDKGFAQLKQKRSLLPAITHVDYSARVQTVHKQTNIEFHSLISAFKKLTGVSVLINTSFNVRGEPPVCTPEDAIECFLRTEMDYLLMNNIRLDKKKMKSNDIEKARQTKFELD